MKDGIQIADLRADYEAGVFIHELAALAGVVVHSVHAYASKNKWLPRPRRHLQFSKYPIQPPPPTTIYGGWWCGACSFRCQSVVEYKTHKAMH